jgi:hypothetical protein
MRLSAKLVSLLVLAALSLTACQKLSPQPDTSEPETDGDQSAGQPEPSPPADLSDDEQFDAEMAQFREEYEPLTDEEAIELTRVQQRIIMAAIQEYVNVYGTAPDVPMAPPYPISRLGGMRDEEYHIYSRINLLYASLKNVPSCDEILWDLPYGSETQGSLEDPGAFVDAYGMYMDYQPMGGPGGSPVLVSGGPDGYIGGEFAADDIRSDD